MDSVIFAAALDSLPADEESFVEKMRATHDAGKWIAAEYDLGA